MTPLETVLVSAAWISLGAVVYAYAGYPLVISVLARLFGRYRRPPRLNVENLPSVTLVIAAYNEAAVIEDRLRNALALQYPKDMLEILVCTDGCTDGTDRIVRSYADRGVRVLAFPERRGKSAVLNDAVKAARGEVVVFSDANTFTHPLAIQNLIRWFDDPRVTAVCGKLVLTDPETGRNVDGLYWKYETFLKMQEGKLGALLGANGGIYALRVSRFVRIPDETIVDDLVIPLLAKVHNGGDIVYDTAAVAEEETPARLRAEFHRRSRIGAGGFSCLALLAGLLNPLRGWVCFTFLSHKLLRWCCPFLLICLLATTALLWEQPIYRALFLAQFGFYTVSILAAYLPGRHPALRVLRLCSMFTGMNLALLVGFGRWLRNTQSATWKRTERSTEGEPAVAAAGLGQELSQVR
jgi:cellulose synthase/poly-beta-1,6-N-acetylglucosamine synthase-like glycosyltransferase